MILWQVLGNEVFKNFKIDMNNCDDVCLGFRINKLQAEIDTLVVGREGMVSVDSPSIG